MFKVYVYKQNSNDIGRFDFSNFRLDKNINLLPSLIVIKKAKLVGDMQIGA